MIYPQINMCHPVRELWWIGPMPKKEAERQALLLKSFDIKRKMEQMVKLIHKVRKMYRKEGTPEYLDKLQEYETRYRELYNEYWYDCVFQLPLNRFYEKSDVILIISQKRFRGGI
jgi:hypothetical protein